MRTAALLLAAAAALASVAGCAGIPGRQTDGTSRDAVLATSGLPTARYPLPGGGERLQYSQQPMGFEVWNLDFDAAGRLAAREQTLAHRAFERIGRDTWTQDDVLRAFGRPGRVTQVARFTGDVWSYRFLEQMSRREIHIHLDPQGVVRLVQFTDEDPARDVRFP